MKRNIKTEHLKELNGKLIFPESYDGFARWFVLDFGQNVHICKFMKLFFEKLGGPCHIYPLKNSQDSTIDDILNSKIKDK